MSNVQNTKRLRILSPSPEPALVPEPKWHSFHIDPNHDVVLKSEDGVYFRASSYALQRESGFFKDMFDSLPSKYMLVADAISLEFRAEAIAALLDIYTIPGNVANIRFSASGFDSLHQIHKLFNFLDCHRLLPHANAAFSTACAQEPVKWLLLASSNNDLGSAEKALDKCYYDCSGHVITDIQGIFALIKEIREEWRYPLLLCLSATETYGYPRADGVTTVAWPDGKAVKRFRDCIQQVKGEDAKESGGQGTIR